MIRDELIAFLRSTSFFADASDSVLATAASQMSTQVLPSEHTLFEEGGPGDAAYLVLEGEVALVADGIELMCRGKGEMVGEFSLIDDQPRSAAAVARSPLTVLRWDRRAFLETLALDPAVAQAILRILTRKLRDDVGRGVGLIQAQASWRYDLERAREIQSGMLPAQCIRESGLEVAGHCAPADAVGGDFYDVMPDRGAGTALIVADVMGHGFYSGLFVAMAKSCLHTQARFDPAPRAMMDAMRATLALSEQWPVLMSCVYLQFQPGENRLAYANAGHPHPLHWQQATSSVTPLEVLDPILGAQDVGEVEYSVRRVDWRAGDLLLLYSDGLTEARSASGEMFGRRRLEQALAAARGADAVTVRDRVLAQVSRHLGPGAPDDDLTLVVARAVAADG